MGRAEKLVFKLRRHVAFFLSPTYVVLLVAFTDPSLSLHFQGRILCAMGMLVPYLSMCSQLEKTKV